METKGNKPSLGWAILSLVLPVAMILYGTLVVGVRPAQHHADGPAAVLGHGLRRYSGTLPRA